MKIRILFLVLCLLVIGVSCNASAEEEQMSRQLTFGVETLVEDLTNLSLESPSATAHVKERTHYMANNFVLRTPSDFNSYQRKVCREIEATVRVGFWDLYAAAGYQQAGNKDASIEYMQKVPHRIKHITRLLDELK